MQGRGNFDDPHLARSEIIGPAQRIGQARTILRRVPFHDDQLRRNPVTPRLGDPAAGEGLHAVEQVAAMIIVAGRHNQGKIRAAGAGHYFGVAVKHRCQPKVRSSARKRNRGIQRKYQTTLYWYCTYSGMLYGKM